MSGRHQKHPSNDCPAPFRRYKDATSIPNIPPPSLARLMLGSRSWLVALVRTRCPEWFRVSVFHP
jgi:hypothetical protein